jgi:hypothetical protein
MLKIQCPGCNAKATISIIDPVYEGPYRCWKCRGFFKIRIENEELQSCEPWSEEEFENEQQAEFFIDDKK